MSNFDGNFEGVPDGIFKKERHFQLPVFCEDSESAIRFEIQPT